MVLLAVGEFHLVLSLNDFVYLNQRLYMPKDDVPKSIKPLLTNLQEIKIQRDNLLQVLKMIVLKGGCLHDQIERILGNLYEPPPTSIQKCIHSCPVCLGTVDDFIMPVSRKGLCTFLAKVFINNTSTSLTPSLLEDKFKKICKHRYYDLQLSQE